MSVNINADTTNGLVLTSDTSGEIKLQAGGADIATVSSTGITMASGKTLPASALTGSLPAIDGSSLTGISTPVRQIVHTNNKTQSSLTTSTTFTELSTNFRVAITPTNSSSDIILEAWIPYSGAGTSQLWNFYFYDVTNSSVVNQGNANGTRAQALVGWRGEHHDSNDCGVLYLKTITPANSTSARTYTIRGRCETNQTIYFNYSSLANSNWGWTGASLVTATEIE